MTGIAQQPRGHESVPAVVPLPADDPDRCTVGALQEQLHLAGQGAPPATSIRSSEGIPRSSIAQRSIPPVAAASNSGSSQGVDSTAAAYAVAALRAREHDGRGVVARMGQRHGQLQTSIGSDRSRASVQAQLRRRIADDLDVERPATAAERLDRRLLRGEARREVTARTGPVPAGAQLGRPEKPVGEARAPFQGTFDPIDLDQVDPERRNARGRGQGVITAAEVESPLPAG